MLSVRKGVTDLSEKHEPRYLDEVEAITGPFLQDPQLDDILRYESKDFFPSYALEQAGNIYFGALRILATWRHKDRLKANVGAQDAQAWNDTWAQGLTLKRIKKIAAHEPNDQIELLIDMRDLRSECDNREMGASVLALFAQVEAQKSSPQPELPQPKLAPSVTPKSSVDKATPTPSTKEKIAPSEELREHQHPYMNDIRSYLDLPPQTMQIKVGEQVKIYKVHGCSAIAPTGAGKSAVAGRTTVAAGIGEPHPVESHRAKTCLFVTSSRDLVEQTAGVSGDDTFRRFAAEGLKIAYYHADVEEFPHDADLVIITDEMFVRHISNGTIFGKKFDLLMIDELHHLTAPRFLKAYLEEWRTSKKEGSVPLPTVGFTATGEYNDEKDVRKILPYTIEHADTLSYIEEGILNQGQFFLMKVDGDYELDAELDGSAELHISRKRAKEEELRLMRRAIVDFFEPLIHEGRRGIIFCEPGGGSKQARLLAEDFAQLKLADGTNVQSRCFNFAYNSAQQNRKYRDEYHAGKVQVLTSTAIGIEGFNADIDFIGIEGATSSLLKIRQIMGRATRKSETFPTSIYAHFFTGNRPTKTFMHALGLDTVEQGVIIGKKLAHGRGPSRIRKDAEKALTEANIPEVIRPMLTRVHLRHVNELHTTLQEIPPDYVPFHTVYAPVKDTISEASAIRRLEMAEYHWIGRIKRDRAAAIDRHYEPAAEHFFTDNPLPPRATDEFKTCTSTAKELEVSTNHVQTLYARLQARPESKAVKTVSRIGKNGRINPHYGPELRALLKVELDSIPLADSTDKPPTTFADSIGMSEATLAKYMEELCITAVFKRKADKKGFCDMISEKQQQAIAARAEKYPWATDKEWTKARIEREAQDTENYIKLTAEELALGEMRRCHPEGRESMVRELPHWSETQARAIIERFRGRMLSLPAHLATTTMAVALTNVSSSLPISFRKSETLIKIPLPGSRPIVAFTWEALRKLQVRYGLRSGTSYYEPDYDKFPQGPDDMDPAKHIYARAFQLQFTTAARLGNPDGIID